MKDRTNVSIDSEILKAARSHKLVLSSILEDAIRKELSILKQNEWMDTNKEGIDSYNKQIRSNGVFSEDMRTF